MAADYPISGPSALSRVRFAQILADAGSPAAREATSMWLALTAADVRAEAFLAFFRQESRYGTVGIGKDFDTKNPGNVRSPERATTARTIVNTPRGPFAKYPTWADGTADWAARMVGPKYAGAGLTTVRTVLPRYAPSGDQGNSPTAYIAAVLASIEEWLPQGTGGPPVALSKPTVVQRPSPNRNGYGSPHAPKAITLHITEGSGQSAVGWLTNPASGASANYVNVEDGTLYELVPPTESAWCNGDVQKPNLANPVVAAVVASGHNANTATISVESAGFTSMGQGGSLKPAQIDSLVRLCAWLCQQFHIPPDKDHIIGHYQWNSVTRPNCPGFSPQEWSAWIGKIAALVGGTAPSEGGDVKEPQAGTFQTYINAAKETITVINFGGEAKKVQGTNIADAGISVSNDAGEQFDRSVQGNKFRDWSKR